MRERENIQAGTPTPTPWGRRWTVTFLYELLIRSPSFISSIDTSFLILFSVTLALFFFLFLFLGVNLEDVSQGSFQYTLFRLSVSCSIQQTAKTKADRLCIVSSKLTVSVKASPRFWHYCLTLGRRMKEGRRLVPFLLSSWSLLFHHLVSLRFFSKLSRLVFTLLHLSKLSTDTNKTKQMDHIVFSPHLPSPHSF